MAYDPNEDKEVYFGTEFLDAIEQPFSNLGSWISAQAEDNPDAWTDDAIRLAFGGISNVMTYTPLGQALSYIGQAEDFIADRARDLNQHLTPWLDPRFAGWGTRIATGLLADKGISRVLRAGTRGATTAARGTARISDDLAVNLRKIIDDPKYGNITSKYEGPLPWSEGDIPNIVAKLDDDIPLSPLNPDEARKLGSIPFESQKLLRNVTQPQLDKIQEVMSKWGMSVGEEFNWWDFAEQRKGSGQIIDGVKTGKSIDEARELIEAIQSLPTSGITFRTVSRRLNQAFKDAYEPILKDLGITQVQTHHTMALVDSIPLYHRLTTYSDEWWEMTSNLVRDWNIAPGRDIDNLLALFGGSGRTKIKVVDGDIWAKRGYPVGMEFNRNTLHSIAHAYYRDILKTLQLKPEDIVKKLDDAALIGPEQLRKTRLELANKYAKVVNESKEILKRSFEVFKDTAIDMKDKRVLGTRPTNEIFDEWVNRLHDLDDTGKIPGLESKYQADILDIIIKEITGEIETGNLPSIVGETMSQVDFNRWLAKLKRSDKWNEMGLAEQMKYLQEQTKMTYEQIDALLTADPDFNLDDVLP